VPAQQSLAPDLTRQDLAKVARTRVFFGHQSVGMNVLDAVPAVYAENGRTPPPIERDGVRPGPEGGFVAHAFLGENGKPLDKIHDFDARLRSGPASRIDVAIMKLCYIDIEAGTDVAAVFDAYRTTISALERDFPHLTLIKATVPLTTEAGFRSRLKARLRMAGRFSQAENVARERLNALLRQEYGAGPLLDLAALESSTPDGTRTIGRYDGREYYALYDGYASDVGHLNSAGAHRVATAWLKLIAQVSAR
jgi:hypothetical protein